jgi:hypothetical protein
MSESPCRMTIGKAELVINQQEFQTIWSSVKKRMQDLVEWRHEDVSRITVEETLYFLGHRNGSTHE